MTVAEAALRWDVTQRQAEEWLRRFVVAGYAVEADGSYFATTKALRLNLPLDEVEEAV
jgi:hypothetical protein